MAWTDRPYSSPRNRSPEDLPQKYTPQKASIGLNQLGQEYWPAFQSPGQAGHLKASFEARKAAENEQGHHKSAEPPKGARHDPRHAYDAAVRQREAVDGHEQRLAGVRQSQISRQSSENMGVACPASIRLYNPVRNFQARGAARVRQSQIFRQSSDNPLVHGQGLTNDDSLSETVKGSGTARSRGHDTASNFSLSQNPRFAGRHAFEAKNDHVESTPRRSRAAVPSHQLTETERKMEQDVATQYPHGLPAGLLRAAKRMGLQTGPLAHGHTNSAPARTLYTLTHTN